MTLFISIAIALVAGLLMTRLTKIFNMPDVTAYLLAGILVGPYVLGQLGIEGLGFTTSEAVNNLDLLSNLALGFIAFALGSEFMLPKLKSIGKQAVTVGVFQAVVATVLVMITLFLLHLIIPDKLNTPTVIVMSAIAAATAPASTLLVVRQYKAQGPVTNMLLPVVALDDAVGLIIFAICMGVAKAISVAGGTLDPVSIIVNPLIEIIASFALGTILGLLLSVVEKWFNSNKHRMVFIVSAVILTVALSMMEFDFGSISVGFSPLLVCMMLGTVFCNTCEVAEEMLERADKWTSPLYCLFFVLSGAALKLDVFTDITIVLIGIVYIIFRAAGKCLGAFTSAKFTHCGPTVTKYLGITLLPQEGVSLGMSLTAAQMLGDTGALIRNLTLFAVLIYELIAPTLTKIALTKAGEIQPKSEEVINRRETTIKEIQEKRSEQQ